VVDKSLYKQCIKDLANMGCLEVSANGYLRVREPCTACYQHHSNDVLCSEARVLMTQAIGEGVA